MKTIRIITVIAVLFIMSANANAQRFAIATNLPDYAALGTINMELDFAVARHISLDMTTRVNPWVFNKGNEGKQYQNKMQSYALGVRYWPWYIYSGLWTGVKAQYMEYDNGGIRNRANEKGDAFGAGISGGYMFIISPTFNINIGLGAWAGYKKYRRYEWTCCGPELERGGQFFVWPNELILSAVYIF